MLGLMYTLLSWPSWLNKHTYIVCLRGKCSTLT